MKFNKKLIINVMIVFIIILIIQLMSNICLAKNFVMKNMVDDAATFSKDKNTFVRKYKVGYKLSSDSGIDSYKNNYLWLCLGHGKYSGIDSSNDIKCTLDINMTSTGKKSLGKYTSKIKKGTGKSQINQNNTTQTKKLAYLAWISNKVHKTGYADEPSTKGTLHWYIYVADNMDKLIGKFYYKIQNRGGYPSGKEEKVMKWAENYSKSESSGSTAKITKKSTNPKMVVKSYKGKKYMYMGPFKISTKGKIKSVTTKVGNTSYDTPKIAYSLGGEPVNDINRIKSNKTFYVATARKTIVDAKSASVTIQTIGKSGGGTILYNGGSTSGYIQARLIFIGHKTGQSQLVFAGRIAESDKETDSLTYQLNSSPKGHLTINKIGIYAGDDEYEDVQGIKFKLYVMNGNNKKYVRINNLNSITSGSVTVTAQKNDVNESEATVFTTPESGTVDINKIDLGNYYFEETSGSSNYRNDIYEAKVQVGDDDEQNLTVQNARIVGPIVVKNNTETSLMIKDYRKRGALKIIKQDEESGKRLSNVGFKIYNSDTGYYLVAEKNQWDGKYWMDPRPANGFTEDENNATIFYTDNNGEIYIEHLDVGNYVIQEISNPNYGYLELADEEEIEITENDNPKVITINNEKNTGNLSINKLDYDNRDLSLSNVDFKILTQNEDGNDEYVVINNIGNGIAQGTVRISDDSGMSTTSNSSQATTFRTDNKGQANIVNMLEGTYKIEEVSVGYNFGYDVDGNYIWYKTDEVDENGNSEEQKLADDEEPRIIIAVEHQSSLETSNVNTNQYNRVYVYNKRKYIKVSGFAWEDRINDNKESKKDSRWVENTDDKRLQYVPVTLKKADGSVIGTTITDKDGKYVFGDYENDSNAQKILIEDLKGAYVEFEYNGMGYKSLDDYNTPEFSLQEKKNSDGKVISKIIVNDKNTATDSDLRDDFNNKYATIGKNSSFNNNNQKTYDIRYNSSNHESKVIYGNNLKYGYEGQKYPISGIDDQYKIKAHTKQKTENIICTDYTIDTLRQNGISEVSGINLGVEEREMPDLAITEDMEKVDISLNGYTHTYKYEQRYKNANEFAGGDGFNVNVKFASKYSENSYTREVYASDVVYNNQAENKGKLKISMTYKIRLRNESTNLTSTIKTLANYYDARYDSIDVKDAEGNSLKVETAGGRNGLRRANITVNQQLENQITREIYITYNLSNEAINSLLNDNMTLNSVSEIASYSTIQSNKVYAGIDIDSAPDNATPTDNNTYEDDTDRAPSLKLQLKDPRVVQGTVWEDGAIQSLLKKQGYEKQRVGDGIYDTKENTVKKVKVELISKQEGKVAKLYNTNNAISDAVTETDEKGKYIFTGVIPDKYYVRFTYGDSSVIYDPQGNVKKNVVAEDYKSTIYRGGNKQAVAAMTDYWYRGETSDKNVSRLSDAKDTIGVNQDGTEIPDIVNNRTTENEITYETASKSRGLKEIKADTREFDIKLEYDINLDNTTEYIDEFVNNKLIFNFDNIDFGIIERPIQELKLKKEIDNVKISLANGVNLVNGNPKTEILSGVKILGDDVYVEMDNELMQGAKLTVKYAISVDNSGCEIDYNDKDYYIYGTVPANNENYMIATVVDMFDYLPEDVTLNTTDQEDWKIQKITSDMKGKLLSNEVYKAVEKRTNIVHLNPAKKVFEMEPGSERRSTSLTVDKLLTSLSDDLTFENDIEIIKLRGRKSRNSTPGNYNPTTNQIHEEDDDNVTLTITGPTGSNKQYVVYGVVGISMLIVIGIGIIVIKKKILNK